MLAREASLLAELPSVGTALLTMLHITFFAREGPPTII